MNIRFGGVYFTWNLHAEQRTASVKRKQLSESSTLEGTKLKTCLLNTAQHQSAQRQSKQTEYGTKLLRLCFHTLLKLHNIYIYQFDIFASAIYSSNSQRLKLSWCVAMFVIPYFIRLNTDISENGFCNGNSVEAMFKQQSERIDALIGTRRGLCKETQSGFL